MGLSILIVDDSATTRALIRRTIALSGLEQTTCLEAANGREGLDMAIRHHPDLVLADLQMDQMNGVEMTRALAADQRTKDIPVVVISAEPSLTTIAVLEEVGIKGHVPKPFTPERVGQVVRAVLGATHA